MCEDPTQKKFRPDSGGKFRGADQALRPYLHLNMKGKLRLEVGSHFFPRLKDPTSWSFDTTSERRNTRGIDPSTLKAKSNRISQNQRLKGVVVR